MKRILAISSCLLMIASVGQAAAPTSNGGLWSNTTTWVEGVLPVYLVTDARLTGGTTTVDDPDAAAKTVEVGRGGTATLDVIAGGTLNANKVNVGTRTGGTGHLTINSGGTVNSVQKSQVGISPGSLSTMTINSGGAWTGLGSLVIGGTSDGLLTMNGGTITQTAQMEIGSGNGGGLGTAVIHDGIISIIDNGFHIANNTAAGGSSVTMNGGLLYSKTFNVGRKADGSMTLNGGAIETGALTIGNHFTNTTFGVFDLLGGSITATNTAASALGFKNAGDLLNIENDGLLILGGDQWASIDSSVSSGYIDWDNGSGMAGVGDKTWVNGTGSYLHSEFDGTETTVWVNQTIPEPATMGLLGLSALALFIRKRFMS